MHSVIVAVDLPEIRDSMTNDERKRAVEVERILADIAKRASGILSLARGVCVLPLDNNLPFLVETIVEIDKSGFSYRVFSSDSSIKAAEGGPQE